MKKLLPLLILTLFLASASSGAVVQDSLMHTLIDGSGTLYTGIITKGNKEKGEFPTYREAYNISLKGKED